VKDIGRADLAINLADIVYSHTEVLNNVIEEIYQSKHKHDVGRVGHFVQGFSICSIIGRRKMGCMYRITLLLAIT